MKKLSNFLNKALMSAQSSTMLPQIFPSTMAVTIPVIAAILQQEIWPYIPLWPWLLLYLAVLFNVWIGGLWGGIASTAIATLLVLYFFVPPDASREVQNLEYNYAIAVFAVTGLLVTVMHEKLNRNHMALQKANDSLIKTNQDRLTFALASTRASLWEWDVQNNKLFLSDNFCSMCGFDPARSLSYDAWLASIHTADQASVVDTLNRSVMAGLDINLESRVSNPPVHHERWLMTRGEPVFDEPGKAALNRGIVLDITQRKR